MIYQDPATLFRSEVTIAWSNDGQRIAACDQFGAVKLVDILGHGKVLTAEMSLTHAIISLHGSPDDRRLLVVQGNRAWINME
jgi:hypothetical protein